MTDSKTVNIRGVTAPYARRTRQQPPGRRYGDGLFSSARPRAALFMSDTTLLIPPRGRALAGLSELQRQCDCTTAAFLGLLKKRKKKTRFGLPRTAAAITALFFSLFYH